MEELAERIFNSGNKYYGSQGFEAQFLCQITPLSFPVQQVCETAKFIEQICLHIL